jgi:DNA-binding transcriptional MerR regulator
MNTDEQLMTISEMCSTFDVTARTLRFYEDKGLIAPKRVGQKRLYGRRENARMTLIVFGKQFGFSLEEIRELLEMYKSGEGRVSQLLRARELAKTRLADLKEERAKLDGAVNELSRQIGEGEKMIERLRAAQNTESQ